MKAKGILNTKAAAVGAGVLVAGGLLYLFAGKAKEEVKAAAKGVGEAVDPTSNENIFYRFANKIVDALDDGNMNDSNTVGTAVHSVMEGWNSYDQEQLRSTK